MQTLGAVEAQHTLRTAVARHDELRLRDAQATDERPLDREEALELLALGEVVARKAAYGRQLTVRSARGAGASWTQIGAALGTSRQAAWEAHTRWLEEQTEDDRRSGDAGLGPEDTADERGRSGRADDG